MNIPDFYLIKDYLQVIVDAISKAISSDIPEFKDAHPLETKNYMSMLRGDLINTNIRSNGGSALIIHPFNRGTWAGRIYIDSINKVTFCIMSEGALKKMLKSTGQKFPHYAAMLILAENNDVHTKYEPQSLFDKDVVSDLYDENELEEEFKNIMGSELSEFKGYHHLIVSYAASGNIIVSLRAICFTPKFEIAKEWDLMDMVRPDSLGLTIITEHQESSTDVQTLLSVKPPISQLKEEFEGEKPLVMIKKQEGKKQG